MAAYGSASIGQLSESTWDAEAFIEFSKQPDYVGDPYTDTWLSDLNPTTSGVNRFVLVHNLEALRETKHERIQKWATTLKKPV
jgi:hypothetical protein